ncbi:MAG: DinB family protein [Anaerolineae bacterium]|nr:DinB family protein [Gemmatimonadaceae bacterium]
MKRAIPLLLLLCATPAAAQQTVSANPALAVGTAKYMWELMTNFVTKAAEQMPEADYAFRPTHDVRTFGQLVGHVAGAQNLICAAALGEKAGNEDDIEKSTTTKAGLLTALRASSQYCQRAYAQSDAASAGATTLFGGPSTRLRALVLNATHNSEHYGNMVTYMRIRGMVPPSSQPAPPRTGTQ